MKIEKIWFDGDYLYGCDESGKVYRQSLLWYPRLRVAEFAKLAGINASLLRNYINGFKKPSKERENQILEQIHKLSEEYANVAF